MVAVARDDAPVLAISDVGIAISDQSHAAI